MLWTALQDPDPVLIFENVMLYNRKGKLAENAGPVDIDRAVVRRAGRDVTLITYGGSLFKTLEAAEALAKRRDRRRGDRSAQPATRWTWKRSWPRSRTHRAVMVDEGWHTGSLAAEIGMQLAEDAFFDLDAPLARVCSAEVPMPYAEHLEQAAIPQVPAIVAAAKALMEARP